MSSDSTRDPPPDQAPPPKPSTEELPGAGFVDLESISREAERPQQPAVTPEAKRPAMQGGMQLTGAFDLSFGGAPVATTEVKPYTGMALAMRQLFGPIEELLHDRAGGDDAISLRGSSVDDSCSRFAMDLLRVTEQYPCVPLFVKTDALYCEGRAVLREAQKSGSGLYRLYAAGVQTLTIVQGIDRAQAETLARVLTSPEREELTEAERDGDVARWFWELGLTHVRMGILETFDEVAPLPPSDIPALEVPDQAVEQMVRLKSRLLSSITGLPLGGARRRAVRNFTVSQDDLRALDRELFALGAKLITSEKRTPGVLPFPELPPLEAELRSTLESEATQIDSRELEALLQVAILLEDAERAVPVIDAIVRRARRLFDAGEVEKGLRFFKGLRTWGLQEPGAKRKMEAVEAIFARASKPDVLLPLLDRYASLPLAVNAQVREFLNLLPFGMTATVGIRVGRPHPPSDLLDLFRLRLSEELQEIIDGREQLSPEQQAGVLDGAVVIKLRAVGELANLFSEAESAQARQAAARATVALDPAVGRPLVDRLIADEDAAVRASVVGAILKHPKADVLAPALVLALGGAAATHWLFSEKRAAAFAIAQVMKAAAGERLRELIKRANPYRRPSISQVRAAAALALALLRDGSDVRVLVELSRDNERPIVADAVKAALQYLKLQGGDADRHLEQAVRALNRYDLEEDATPAGPSATGEAAAGATPQQVSNEVSPQLLRAMRVDALLEEQGDPVRVLGAELVLQLSEAIARGLEKDFSGDAFTIAIGRSAHAVEKLHEQGGGAVALQHFGNHFFVNGRRLRLPFRVFSKSAPLTTVLTRLRVQEVMFAEPPSRADLTEVLYALMTAYKVEREPWNTLERMFVRVRLRELSLIAESWGRSGDVWVDVKANAARLFGTLYLWFEDVARLPDQTDLLPMRGERLVRELTDAQEESEILIDGLLGPKDNGGDAVLYAAHSVALAATVARWLGCRRDQIASIVRCGLYRNLGLLSGANALIGDLGAESANEALELLRTPLYSAARIAAASAAGQRDLQLPFITAFESLAPISTDGRRGRRYMRPVAKLMHAQILAVAERYVFLTSRFPRRAPLAQDQAIAVMLQDPELDPRLVQAFANSSGLIPSGARVRLSDGREALVVSAPLSMSSQDPLVLRIMVGSDGLSAHDLLSGAPLVAFTGEESSVPEIVGVAESGSSSTLTLEDLTPILM